MLANAFLGNERAFHTFKFNPSAVSWDYTENTRSFDTLGGRVVQLLSAKVDRLTVQGVAGSRQELQRIAQNLKQIITYHIKTQQPVIFRVPSKGWEFQVFVESVQNLGWGVPTVSYPYQLILAVADDLTGIKAKEINERMFDRLTDGIGYNPNVHGGDAPGFAELVNSLQLTNPILTVETQTDADKRFDEIVINPTGVMGDIIVQIAKTQLGVPYVFGAQEAGLRFDCSGFTSWVYEKATGKDMPHSAAAQQDLFIPVRNRQDLEPGHLVFFWFPNSRGIPAGRASHVGIYIGNGEMIDASSSKDAIVIRDVFWDSLIRGGAPPTGWTLLDKYKKGSGGGTGQAGGQQ